MTLGRGTLGIIGLVLSCAVLIVTMWLLLKTADAPDPRARRLPEGVPANAARNPQVARQHVLHELCIAQCATDEHNCRAMVTEIGGESACTETRATCLHACP